MNHHLDYQITSQPILLVDCWNGGTGLQYELIESANGTTKFRGKLQEADAVNKNKRLYPFDVLDANMKRLQETVDNRGLLGELDHPSDSIVHFEKASHLITKLWWDGKTLMGEGEILNTPHGKVLKSLMESGVRIGMSSRGVGNGTSNENGVFVIGESYKLITFDAVADPSTFAAFQEKVVGLKGGEPKESLFATKNEGTHIYTNKEIVKALFGGLIKEHLNETKARLG